MTDFDEIAELRAEVDALKKTLATTFAFALSAYEYSLASAPLADQPEALANVLSAIVQQTDAAAIFTTATEDQLAEIDSTRSRVSALLRQ